MATNNKPKRSTPAQGNAAAPKAPEVEQPAQTAEVKAEHQFDNPDDLAHFIHHNPEFGTLPLDEQNALREKLVTLSRAKAAE